MKDKRKINDKTENKLCDGHSEAFELFWRAIDVVYSTDKLSNEQLEIIKNNHHETETKIITFIGTPKEEIVEASYADDVCYIVIGKYGRTGFSSLVMGGTSAFVLQHATKPVIVVPYKKQRH